MTGFWHACSCGCGLWHRVVDGLVVCPHPNFALLYADKPGVLFVVEPSEICPPCLFELDDVLTAKSRGARRALSAGQLTTVAVLSASLEEAEGAWRDVSQTEFAVGVMLAEGGAVWEHES